MPQTAEHTLQTATLGGGCFWCMEALLDQIKGVESAVSGYAGGENSNPFYEGVCTGKTGHAEVVQVQFDPAVLVYSDLLRIFLSVHNPTAEYKIGALKGSQYRSVIFYYNADQRQTAVKIINELQSLFKKPIVTEVLPYTTFFRAQERHQQYYKRDPAKAYCRSVINPRLAALRKRFGEMLKKKPPVAS